MPQTMMSAAVVPKSFKASETIASLLGTIHRMRVGIFYRMAQEIERRHQHLHCKIKPNIVLMVPEVIVAAGFSERLNL